jgi:hypothetical protein
VICRLSLVRKLVTEYLKSQLHCRVHWVCYAVMNAGGVLKSGPCFRSASLVPGKMMQCFELAPLGNVADALNGGVDWCGNDCARKSGGGD